MERLKTIKVRIKLNNPTMEVLIPSDQYPNFKKLSREKQEDIVITKGTIKYSSIEISKNSTIKVIH